MSLGSHTGAGRRSIARRPAQLAAIVGLALLLATCGGRDGSSSLQTPAPTATPTVAPTAAIRIDGLRQMLAESGRASLRVCVFVDPASAASPTQAQTLFEDALTQLRAGFATPIAVDLVSRCEATPVFLATNSRHVQNSASGLPVGSPMRVSKSEVSPTALIVAVTTRDKIDAIFGSLVTRRGAEQVVCDGGNCAEVTTSVYVADTAVSDPSARRAALLEGLGFAGRT